MKGWILPTPLWQVSGWSLSHTKGREQAGSGGGHSCGRGLQGRARETGELPASPALLLPPTESCGMKATPLVTLFLSPPQLWAHHKHLLRLPQHRLLHRTQRTLREHCHARADGPPARVRGGGLRLPAGVLRVWDAQQGPGASPGEAELSGAPGSPASLPLAPTPLLPGEPGCFFAGPAKLRPLATPANKRHP